MTNNELLMYGCIYRSPNSHDANNESLNTLIYELDQVKSAYKQLVGNFNFGSICWEDGIATSSTESTFVNTLQDTYMTQHVAEPTRGRNGQEPSILDLIISNDPNIVSDISYESPLGKSDHACRTFYLKCYRNKSDQTRKFYLYDKGDFKQVNADLVNINWEREIGHLADPSSAYAAFSEIMLALIDKHVPTKTLYPSRKHKNCFGKDILRSVKKKHTAWQRYMETRSGEKYLEYVRQRNKVIKLTKQVQRDYDKNIAKEAKSNPKKFWKYVKSKTKARSNIPDLCIDEEDPEKGLATEDKDKADVLAVFYSSVFTREPSGPIPEPKQQETSAAIHTTIFSEARIKKKLTTLNT